MANRWAWSPLAARVPSVVGSSKLFMILDMSSMILGADHERLSLH
jgi:hypothetical protein